LTNLLATSVNDKWRTELDCGGHWRWRRPIVWNQKACESKQNTKNPNYFIFFGLSAWNGLQN